MVCFFCDNSATVTVQFTDGQTRYFCDTDYSMIRRQLESLDTSSYTVRFLPGSRMYGEGLHV